MKKGFFLMLLWTGVTSAYETPTHALMSDESVLESILKVDVVFLTSVGIDLSVGLEEAVFPSIVPKDPENPKPDEVVFKEEASILEILRGGSVLEDGFDSEGEFRSPNHFFDPQHVGLPLSVIRRGVQIHQADYSSAEWALEIANSGDELDIPAQKFSYQDALRYYFRALTADLESERERQFGFMFRALGHVIHHIQDMAQPQHVRNDDHCDFVQVISKFPDNFVCYVGHNPSYYETYSSIERRNINFSRGDYPIPVFSTAREFWSNQAFSGQAQFTSFNFVSDATSFYDDGEGSIGRHPLYALPEPAQTVASVHISGLLDDDPSVSAESKNGLLLKLGCQDISNDECKVDFFANEITDYHTGEPSQLNTRAASMSLFDNELRSRNIAPDSRELYPRGVRLTSMNRFTSNEAHKFLIPRAVAYGAGLINHFFRGRLEIERAEFGNFEGDVELVVRNTSVNGESLLEGEFQVYYEDPDTRVRTRQTVTQGPPLNIAASESVTLKFNYPRLSEEDRNDPFTIVYAGQIGEETGVATNVFSVDEVEPLLLPAITSAIDSSSNFVDCGNQYRITDGGEVWLTGTNLNEIDFITVSQSGVSKSYPPKLPGNSFFNLTKGDFASGEVGVKVQSLNGLESNEFTVQMVPAFEIHDFSAQVQDGMKVVLQGTGFGSNPGTVGGHDIAHWSDDRIEFIYDEPVAGPTHENVKKADCLNRNLTFTEVPAQATTIGSSTLPLEPPHILHVCGDENNAVNMAGRQLVTALAENFYPKGYLSGETSSAKLFFDTTNSDCGFEEGNAVPLENGAYIKLNRHIASNQIQSYSIYLPIGQESGFISGESGKITIYDPDTLLSAP